MHARTDKTMDNIVVGISRLNIKQSLCEIKHENCAPNLIKDSPVEMSSMENSLFMLKQNDGGNHNSLDFNENGWVEELERDEDNCNQNIGIQKSYLFSERRKMPSRASKETSLLKIKRRTIMKPSKRTQTIHGDFNNLKPADIKKIYLNKKLTNFKPSSLETIFEEASCNESDDLSCSRLMSGRKVRRTISFSDGYRYTKSLVNKRRIKIKKTFGKRFALKKISLEDFLEKFNNIDESEEKINNGQIEKEEYKHLHEEANHSLCLEFSGDKFISNSGSFITSSISSATSTMVFCTESAM